MNINDRIIELENRLTHLDDTVEQLNNIVTEQQLKIATMEKLIKALAKEHSEIKEHLAPEITNSRPPHY